MIHPFSGVILFGNNGTTLDDYRVLKMSLPYRKRRKAPTIIATIPMKTSRVNTSILRLIRKDKKKVESTVVPISGCTTLTGL